MRSPEHTPDGPIRVLIVDDSRAARRMIRRLLSADPEIEVVGEAEDAPSARDAVLQHQPDVMTLDLQMPGMPGINFLERLMRHRPTPVVVITGCEDDARSSMQEEVFARGAVALVPKPHEHYSSAAFAKDAVHAVRAAANRPATTPRAGQRRVELVAMGASTGGTEALCAVFEGLGAANCPVAIVQHMPEAFTRSFAARLDRVGATRVREATQGEIFEPGVALLAPGGAHLAVRRLGDRLQAVLSAEQKVNGHRPSADVLFHSVVRVVGARAVGVLLTGMGDDGARGLKAMRDAGAATIAQDQATSVVWGMPRVAAEIGGASEVLPLPRIGERVGQLAGAPRRGTDGAALRSSAVQSSQIGAGVPRGRVG
jgi:two-component system chemotaxis response regulator CheB